MIKKYSRPTFKESSKFDEEWATLGTSMLPFIFPQSRLLLKKRDDKCLFKVGDIVCYIGEDSKFIAHRVTKVFEKGRILEVSGDASQGGEFIESEAVLGVVSRIVFGPMSYSTNGIWGSSAARITLKYPGMISRSAKATLLLLKIASLIRKRNPFMKKSIKASTIASSVFTLTKLADRLWEYHLLAREELILFFGNNEFFNAYNTIAYSDAVSYNPADLRFREKLFSWEIDAIKNYFPSQPAKVLVGGAGGGREAFELCKQGYKVTAFEPVENLAMAMFERAKEEKLDLNVLVGGYEQFIDDKHSEVTTCVVPPLLTGSMPEVFDAIVLGWGSLTHIRSAKDRHLLFAKCFEKLAPGGTLLASYFIKNTPQKKHPLRQILGKTQAILRRIGDVEVNDKFYAHAGFGHSFEKSEILKLAEDAGLKVVFMNNGEGGDYPHCVMKKLK